MSRNKAFNQVSFHPRASNIPHPDALRRYFTVQNPSYADAPDEDLTAEYLIQRTVAGADGRNPFPSGSNRHNAYNSYIQNETDMIRYNPSYRPARSANDLAAAAKDHSIGEREDNECESCGKEIPEGTGYCRNGVC
jgi:hypothetical protein